MSLSFCQYQLYKPIGSHKDFSCPSSQVSASWLNGNDCSIATATFTCALHQSERKEAVQAVANCYLQCETTQQNVYQHRVAQQPSWGNKKNLNWVHGGRPIFVAWKTRSRKQCSPSHEREIHANTDPAN